MDVEDDDRTVPAIPADMTEPAIPFTPAQDVAPANGVPAGPRAERVASSERLVLGLAEGPALADLTDRGPMRVQEVVRIGTAAATLLAHLHERGRSHGAVTPANLLLGPGGRVQLADIEGSTNGAAGDVGHGRIPPADDVHDLGAALTRALTGEDSATMPTDLPRTLRRVLESATEIDPARRPTARQMAEMLGWVGRGTPAPAAPSEPLWKTSATAAWVFGGAALLVVLLTLVGIAVLRDDPTEVAAPATPTTAPAVPSITAAPSTTAVPPPVTTSTAAPTATEAPALPTALPTALPSFELPTTLPALPTKLPEIPPEAQGLWDRFVEWLKGLF